MKISSFIRVSVLLLVVFWLLVIIGCTHSASQTATTSQAPQTTSTVKPPEVVSVNPGHQAVDIPLNTAIEAVFSSEMDPSTFTLNTFSLQQGTRIIRGSITCSGARAAFQPAEPLSWSVVYTAAISTGVKNTAGLSLAKERVWTFTTTKAPETKVPVVSPSPSTTPASPLTSAAVAVPVTTTAFTSPAPAFTPAPEVISVSPADQSTGVALGSTLEVVFSRDMDPLTFSNATFILQQGLTTIPGAVTCSGTRAALKPAGSLSYQLTYTAVITAGVKDLQGKSIAADYKWSFVTAAAPVYGGFSGGSVIVIPTPSPSPTPEPTPTPITKQVTMYDSDLPAPPMAGMTFHFIVSDPVDPGPGKIRVSYSLFTYSIWFGVENHKLWMSHVPQRNTLPASLVSFYDSIGINQYTTYTESDQKYWFNTIPPWLNIAKYDPNITKMPDLVSLASIDGSVTVSYLVNY